MIIKKLYKFKNYVNVHLILVDPFPIRTTIDELLNEIRDTLWTNDFINKGIEKSFESRADKTIKYIEELCNDSINKSGANSILTDEEKIKSLVWEYIISVSGKNAIVKCFSYKDIPIAELWKQKKSNNPGFDFHSETNNSIIIFGEAKYKSKKDAYNDALKQIVKFIEDGKDVEDLVDLSHFVSNISIQNFNNGYKGYVAAFSAKSISDLSFVNNILANSYFKELLKYSNLILVAVAVDSKGR